MLCMGLDLDNKFENSVFLCKMSMRGCVQYEGFLFCGEERSLSSGQIEVFMKACTLFFGAMMPLKFRYRD